MPHKNSNRKSAGAGAAVNAKQETTTTIKKVAATTTSSSKGKQFARGAKLHHTSSFSAVVGGNNSTNNNRSGARTYNGYRGYATAAPQPPSTHPMWHTHQHPLGQYPSRSSSFEARGGAAAPYEVDLRNSIGAEVTVGNTSHHHHDRQTRRSSSFPTDRSAAQQQQLHLTSSHNSDAPSTATTLTESTTASGAGTKRDRDEELESDNNGKPVAVLMAASYSSISSSPSKSDTMVPAFSNNNHNNSSVPLKKRKKHLDVLRRNGGLTPDGLSTSASATAHPTPSTTTSTPSSSGVCQVSPASTSSAGRSPSSSAPESGQAPSTTQQQQRQEERVDSSAHRRQSSQTVLSEASKVIDTKEIEAAAAATELRGKKVSQPPVTTTSSDGYAIMDNLPLLLHQALTSTRGAFASQHYSMEEEKKEDGVLDHEDKQSILRWTNASCWKIICMDAFRRTILPAFFQTSSLDAFLYNVTHAWGFEEIREGPNAGCFQHTLFRRDEPQLSQGMKLRTKRRSSDNAITSMGSAVEGSTPERTVQRQASVEEREGVAPPPGRAFLRVPSLLTSAAAAARQEAQHPSVEPSRSMASMSSPQHHHQQRGWHPYSAPPSTVEFHGEMSPSSQPYHHHHHHAGAAPHHPAWGNASRFPPHHLPPGGGAAPSHHPAAGHPHHHPFGGMQQHYGGRGVGGGSGSGMMPHHPAHHDRYHHQQQHFEHEMAMQHHRQQQQQQHHPSYVSPSAPQAATGSSHDANYPRPTPTTHFDPTTSKGYPFRPVVVLPDGSNGQQSQQEVASTRAEAAPSPPQHVRSSRGGRRGATTLSSVSSRATPPTIGGRNTSSGEVGASPSSGSSSFPVSQRGKGLRGGSCVRVPLPSPPPQQQHERNYSNGTMNGGSLIENKHGKEVGAAETTKTEATVPQAANEAAASGESPTRTQQSTSALPSNKRPSSRISGAFRKTKMKLPLARSRASPVE